MSKNMGFTLPSAQFFQLRGIVNLNLPKSSLGGEIPAEIGILATLRELNLERNQLEGVIPVEIGHLTRLMTLKLGNNRLRGKIPHEIGNLICLEILDLGSQGCHGYGLATEGGLTGFGTSQSCSVPQTSETSML
jgi:hypothetical protein